MEIITHSGQTWEVASNLPRSLGSDHFVQIGQWYTNCGKTMQFMIVANKAHKRNEAVYFGIITDEVRNCIQNARFSYIVMTTDKLDFVHNWAQTDNLDKARDLFFAHIVSDYDKVTRMNKDSDIRVM